MNAYKFHNNPVSFNTFQLIYQKRGWPVYLQFVFNKYRIFLKYNSSGYYQLVLSYFKKPAFILELCYKKFFMMMSEKYTSATLF